MLQFITRLEFAKFRAIDNCKIYYYKYRYKVLCVGTLRQKCHILFSVVKYSTADSYTCNSISIYFSHTDAHKNKNRQRMRVIEVAVCACKKINKSEQCNIIYTVSQHRFLLWMIYFENRIYLCSCSFIVLGLQCCRSISRIVSGNRAYCIKFEAALIMAAVLTRLPVLVPVNLLFVFV